MKFPPSALAARYLTGLKGVECGGSAHNSFFLDTVNVDNTDSMDTVYKKQEIELCGEAMPVDFVADASRLPFKDKSYDFVISSHMLEHVFDPINVVLEWERVASKYIYIIVPNKEKTFDKEKPLTPIFELHQRNTGILLPKEGVSDDHWTIWDSWSFRDFCMYMSGRKPNLELIEFQHTDDKVGNGIAALFQVH